MEKPRFFLFFMNKKMVLEPEKEYLIGREKDCTIPLPEPTVSRRHAKVYFHAGEYWIQDLDSTNGTSVNFKTVKKTALKNRDRITIGLFNLVFLEQEETGKKQQEYETILKETLILETKMAKILELVKNHDLRDELFEMKKIINLSRERMDALANLDPLTKLFNRRFFDQSIQLETERAQRYGSRLSLIMMDIDHFKSFNDTYGHQKGDEVLHYTAQTVKSILRANDIPCRYGGEEFVIILPGTDLAGAGILAEKIRRKLQGDSIKAQGVEITASFGVCTFISDLEQPESFVERADMALYKAKERGRNRVVKHNAKPRMI